MAAPASVTGIAHPSAKTRSTRYLGMAFTSLCWPCRSVRRGPLCRKVGCAASGRGPEFGGERPLLWREHPQLSGELNGLAARVGVQLGEDGRDVVLNGLGGEEEVCGDGRVAAPSGHEGQDLGF